MKSSSRRHTPSVPTLVTHPASPRNPQLSPLQVRSPCSSLRQCLSRVIVGTFTFLYVCFSYSTRHTTRALLCTFAFRLPRHASRLSVQKLRKLSAGMTIMSFYRADEVSASEMVQQKLSQPASDAHAELPSSATSPFTRHGHGSREEEAFRALNSRSFFLLFFLSTPSTIAGSSSTYVDSHPTFDRDHI